MILQRSLLDNQTFCWLSFVDFYWISEIWWMAAQMLQANRQCANKHDSIISRNVEITTSHTHAHIHAEMHLWCKWFCCCGPCKRITMWRLQLNKSATSLQAIIIETVTGKRNTVYCICICSGVTAYSQFVNTSSEKCCMCWVTKCW